MIQENEFDIILLDLGLPDSTGLDGVKEILTINKTLPIIVLTGNSDEKLGTNSITLGAQDFLKKDEINPYILEKSLGYAFERNKLIHKILEEKS